MSLINEALKKAQRQRTGTAAGSADDSPGQHGPVLKRGATMKAQTMIVITAGAFALIVCSVVLTVYFVNRKPAEPVRPVAVPAVKAPSADPEEPSPVIVAPVIPAPAPVVATASSNPEPSPRAAARPPETVAAPAGRMSEPAAPAVSSISSVSPPAAVPPPDPVAAKPTAPPDPRVQTFVDAIKVAGIRSSGRESKVLMNDRVFRVNEIVERTLRVQLVKVESDSLTFVDANGVTYTKTF